MSDSTSTELTYQTEVTAADNKLDGVSSGAAATEALSALNDLNPADRKAFVENASEYLTRSGELPELMLTIKESEPLNKLFDSASFDSAGLYTSDDNGPDNMGADQIAVLQNAVDTGRLNGSDLSLSEQIACDALIKNYNNIQLSVGQNPTDGLISRDLDLIDQKDTNGSMIREMGENRFGLNSVVAMFSDDQGNFDPDKYQTQFGSASPTKSDLERFKDDPNKYGDLAPSEKQAVDLLIDRFVDLDQDGNTTLDAAEIDEFAKKRNVDYSNPQQQDQIKSQVDDYNEEHTVVAALTEDGIDSLIAQLAEPDNGATVFDALDIRDGKQDGLVSDKALSENTFIGPEAAAAKSLAAHIQQFDDNGDGRIFLTEMAQDSSTYSELASQDEIIRKAQDIKAQNIRDKEADTPGDITDDTAAAMALFGNDKGELDTDQWNSIFAPQLAAGDKGVDVSRDDIWKAIGSDKFDTLTPSEQRGLKALYDNFDQYSSAMQAPTTLGADEFHKAAFEKGIKWNDEKQRNKIIADQDAFNAAPSITDSSDVPDTVALPYWWGGEDEYKFGALMVPGDSYAGALALAELNHMSLDELHERFYDPNPGIVIPSDVYAQYYGEPYEDEEQAA